MKTLFRWPAAIVVAACSILLCLQTSAAQFQDVTTAAGLTNESSYCFSAAWGDYDNDGYIDFYIAEGVTDSHVNALYHNNRDGTFTRMTGTQVGPIAGDVHDSFGCAWIDFNNDGYPDMLVVNGGFSLSRNDLYMNNGDGTFRSAGAGDLTAVPANQGWAACADYDGDGLVDICVPQGSSTSGPYQSRLYHATPSGIFTPIDLGPANSDANDEVWGDYNNDGKPDLFVCNNTSPSSLWRNDGGGHFTQMDNGLPSGGNLYHAAWGDYDNDGNLDIAISSDGGTSIYRNNGQGGFVLVTNLSDAFQGTPAWADYDNDGHLDLLVVGGQNTPRQAHLYHNNGDGTFTSVSEPLTATADNWLSCPWGDYDNDGFMDVLLTHQYGGNKLFHNLGNTNHWIKFKLIGTASNRDAIGAKVRVKATIAGQTVWQLREINGGYIQQNDLRPNFGLGDATTVDWVRIEWPSGNVQEFPGLAANRLFTVTESPAISPTRPSASLNGSVTLTRTVVPGATYQWQFEGGDLIGQTSSTLSLTNIVATQQGHYSVVASNATMLVTNYVYLFVDTTFTKVTTGPVATDLANTWAASWGDYDNDGYADLFVARYMVGPSVVYHNNQDGTFSTVTSVVPQTPDKWTAGLWADFDNDDRIDLFASRDREAALFDFNNGDSTFTNKWFDSLSPWSISAVDYDRDGLLDLYVSSLNSSVNSLYHNKGGRIFQHMTVGQVGSIAGAHTVGGLAWADYDDDGWPDVIAPGGGGTTMMFHNDGMGRFVAVNNAVTEQAGAPLAAAWGDYDNDGRLDLALANTSGGSAVYHNLGNGQFVKAAIGVNLPVCNSVSWADYDNDGFLDLFLTEAGFANTNALYHNNGDGTFTPVTTGSIVSDLPVGAGDPLYVGSYSGLWFDYDNDGFLDLFVSNGNDAGTASTRNFLYHNNGNSNAWLIVKPVGTRSNRSGIGAKVKVLATYAGQARWQRRDISAGDVFNGNNLYAHFGLGNATNVDVLRIEWPSGTVEELSNIAPRQYLTLVEPSLRGALAQDGLFHLWITVSTNRVYQLQASSDLVSWNTLTNCIGTTSYAPIEFVDPEAPSTHTARFYRMR